MRKRPTEDPCWQGRPDWTRHGRACLDSLLICRNHPRFPGEPGARLGSLRPKLGPLSCRRRRKNLSPDTLYMHPGYPTPGTDAVPCICGQSARLGVCPGHPAPASKRPVEGAGRLLRRDQEHPFISGSACVLTPRFGRNRRRASPRRHRHSGNHQPKPCGGIRFARARRPSQNSNAESAGRACRFHQNGPGYAKPPPPYPRPEFRRSCHRATSVPSRRQSGPGARVPSSWPRRFDLPPVLVCPNPAARTAAETRRGVVRAASEAPTLPAQWLSLAGSSARTDHHAART